jgi:Tol biopolymer transport system component
VGCGFRPQGAASDGRGGDDDAHIADAADAANMDGSAVPRDCMAEWRAGTIAFGAPQLISELSTTSGIERDPFVSQDELTIYYSSSTASDGMDIYTASRAHIGDAFGSAAPFSIVNTQQDESKMSISTDGLTLIVCRTEQLGGDDDYMVTRSSTAQAWTTPQTNDLDNVNDDYSPLDPELGSDGRTLYFAPVVEGGDPQQLAVAKRDDTTSEYDIGSISGYSPSDNFSDADPWIDAAGDVLVFSRFDVDVVDVDIMYMTTGSGGRFGSASPVPGVNTVGNVDGDPWVSPDGCRMYFSSNRAGSYDLYFATAQ